MLNNQKLYDRTMIVKMDKDNNRGQNRAAELPSGLGGIGPSLQSFRPQRELGGKCCQNIEMGRPQSQHIS